jgi:hypothetical protein
MGNTETTAPPAGPQAPLLARSLVLEYATLGLDVVGRGLVLAWGEAGAGAGPPGHP